MSRAEAQAELAAIVAPINARRMNGGLGDFIKSSYLPLFRQKWKNSTRYTNEQRISHHLECLYDKPLEFIRRQDLQSLLNQKVQQGLSYSVVNHLRWDLKQIFDVAVAEGLIDRNPAVFLFTPRSARRLKKRCLTLEQSRELLPRLALREQVVVSLALIVGMRPGEILALQRRHCNGGSVFVEQRIYRGEIDTPKTFNSVREVALPKGVERLMEQWLQLLPTSSPTDWVFPSENIVTPLSRDNCLRRCIQPKLNRLGLEWVNFQVLRRTHSSLMRALGADPKAVADQLGHTLDVNLNVYTQTTPDQRREALQILEARLNGATADALSTGVGSG